MKNKVTICDLFSVGNSRVNELPEVGESRQVLWRRTRTGIRNWLLCVNPILEIIWHFFLKKYTKKETNGDQKLAVIPQSDLEIISPFFLKNTPKKTRTGI